MSKNMPPLVDLAKRAASEHAKSLLLPQGQTALNNTYAAAWLDAFHFLQKNPDVLIEFAPIPGFEHFPKER